MASFTKKSQKYRTEIKVPTIFGTVTKVLFHAKKKKPFFTFLFQFFPVTQQAEVFFSNIQDEKPVFQPTGHYSSLWYIRVSCNIFNAYYPG